MSKISTIFKSMGTGIGNMPLGKKIYASLWALTGIFIIVFIGVAAKFTAVGHDSTSTEINALAAIGFVIAMLITVAIFTTVIVSVRLKKGAK